MCVHVPSCSVRLSHIDKLAIEGGVDLELCSRELDELENSHDSFWPAFTADPYAQTNNHG